MGWDNEGVNIQYQADMKEVNNDIILHAASHCTRTDHSFVVYVP